MDVFELNLNVPVGAGHRNLIADLGSEIGRQLPPDALPVRLAITSMDRDHYQCDVGVITGFDGNYGRPESLFEFIPRQHQNYEQFQAVMLIPTGIDCEIGGHSGDAGAAVRLLASVCDRLITHPNAVNAADINEIPDNGLYVEGSVICRLLQGTVALQPVRSNRVLVVMDHHPIEEVRDSVINAVNGARAAFGLDCPKVAILESPVELTATVTETGRAAGRVNGLERLLEVMHNERGTFDAVALSGDIALPDGHDVKYFSGDPLVNPWGGVEAIYTHAVSTITNVPSAHAPCGSQPFSVTHRRRREAGIKIVDPRMASELISITAFECVLKGLLRSPRIVPTLHDSNRPGTISAADISCLVIPAGVLGLPVMAALQQGIHVIAVRENRNLMRNDLARIPWAQGQYIEVNNYLEAAGAIAALKAGVCLSSVRRPLAMAPVEYVRTRSGQELVQQLAGSATAVNRE